MNDLLLFGEIGAGELTAKSFRDYLLAAKGGASVRINSPGGDMFEGLAIYNTIKALGRPVKVIIEGVAASAASLIAMAGNPVVMPSNTFMMVHNPYMQAAGDSGDLRRAAVALRKFTEAMANIYAAKTGKPTAEMLGLMERTTWLTADDALQLGMCDSVVDEVN
jgi:ATP-dependent Clp endopeptidase proteolytic subunit ClpP